MSNRRDGGSNYDRLHNKRKRAASKASMDKGFAAHRKLVNTPTPCRAEGCDRPSRYRHCRKHHALLVDGKLPCPGCGEYICSRGATCHDCLQRESEEAEQKKRELRTTEGPW